MWGAKLKIECIIGQFLDAHVYVLKKDKQCLIIDSGASLEDIKRVIGDCKVMGILLTHGHFDHSCYCLDYAKEFNCNIYANENIKITLTDPKAIYSEDYSTIEDFSQFEIIKEDKTLTLGDFEVNCYYCPGHSLCSECYVIDGVLFAGDVLFENGIGRTDLKYGNKQDMYNSLCKLESITFEKVYSGHGEESDYQFQMKNIKVFKRFLTR